MNNECNTRMHKYSKNFLLLFFGARKKHHQGKQELIARRNGLGTLSNRDIIYCLEHHNIGGDVTEERRKEAVQLLDDLAKKERRRQSDEEVIITKTTIVIRNPKDVRQIIGDALKE